MLGCTTAAPRSRALHVPGPVHLDAHAREELGIIFSLHDLNYALYTLSHVKMAHVCDTRGREREAGFEPLCKTSRGRPRSLLDAFSGTFPAELSRAERSCSGAPDRLAFCQLYNRVVRNMPFLSPYPVAPRHRTTINPL